MKNVARLPSPSYIWDAAVVSSSRRRLWLCGMSLIKIPLSAIIVCTSSHLDLISEQQQPQPQTWGRQTE